MDELLRATRDAITTDRHNYNRMDISRQASATAAAGALAAYTRLQRDYITTALGSAAFPPVWEASPELSRAMPALHRAYFANLHGARNDLNAAGALEDALMNEYVGNLQDDIFRRLFPLEASVPPIFRYGRRRPPAAAPRPHYDDVDDLPAPPPQRRLPRPRRSPDPNAYYYPPPSVVDVDNDDDEETDTDDLWFMGSRALARTFLPSTLPPRRP
jgi:hypothetical protein